MTKISDIALLDSDKETKERYSKRLKRFGFDPRTLGWDTKKNQEARFKIATNSVDMRGSSVLDVGCGLADFHTYLKNELIDISSYSGTDINPDLIDYCQENHIDAKEFMVRNFLLDPMIADSYDIVSMFGILNLKFTDIDNEIFAKRMIAEAFKIAKKVVVVDMLSSMVDPDYIKEDFVYYHDPLKMLDFSLSLTPHVQLRHDYGSIPQREFLLVLRKEPWI